MAPIRVGLVGLRAVEASEIGPHTWAVVALLPTFLHSPDYELVAVCNSSVESSRNAIETHNLPSSTKAYGNPEDLANDPDVDMVVVSVMVTKHFMLTEPALRKNKKVFVEWPIAASTKEAQQLTDLARQNDLKTVVGVQTRADPYVVKIKEIIDSGKLGRITSTSVLGSTSGLPSQSWFKGVEYYLQMNTGANMFHVYFAHFLDTFVHVLGDFDTLQSSLKAEITRVPVLGDDGNVEQEYEKNVPDHILVQGSLKSGAMASIAYRYANLQEAVDDVGTRWIITGTKGEIELTSGQSQWQLHSPKDRLRIKFKGQETEEIAFPASNLSYGEHVADVGLNTSLILDAFAKDDHSRFADFESALQTHKLLDRIVESAGFKY